jgi:hypothetical protein
MLAQIVTEQAFRKDLRSRRLVAIRRGLFYIVLTFFRWTGVLRCCKLKFEGFLVKFGYMKHQEPPHTYTALLSLPLIIENPWILCTSKKGRANPSEACSPLHWQRKKASNQQI